MADYSRLSDKDATINIPTNSSQVQPAGEQKPKRELSIGRLLAQAKPEKCVLALATVALFISALFNMLVPALIGSIIDAISSAANPGHISQGWIYHLLDFFHLNGSPRQVLTGCVLLLCAAVGISAIFACMRGYLYSYAGERVVARLRNQLFTKILALEIGFFDETRTGELVNRLATDTAILKDALTSNISMGLRWGATIIAGLIYLFIISWKLTLVMLSVVPLVGIGGRYYGRMMKDLSKETQDALAKATEVAEESFSNIRTVRSFSREDYQCEMYARKIDHTFKLGTKMAWYYGLFIALMGLIGSGAMILVLWYGASLVLDGTLSSGVLTSFLLYTLTVGFALAGFSGLFGDLMRAVGANDRVFELLDRDPAIPIRGGAKPATCRGHVVFDHVTFAYPSRPTASVLRDVVMELKPGTVTALVGPSGGGKSTIVSLLEHFYEPLYGRVLLDGEDLRNLDQAWLHSKIALVSQEPVLFAGSLRDNIQYGVGQASDEQIRSAARMANAEQFILDFPEAFDTLVGERGVRLSGGQKQRVAIARAVLMNPQILLLDEATSALDAESEHLVQEALDRLMRSQGRTVLVVAHRLSTVKHAHNVVVIDHGEVVEQGTHTDLLARSGLYAKLVRRQLQDGSSRQQQDIDIETEAKLE